MKTVNLRAWASARSSEIAEKPNLLPVPIVPQTSDFSCGAAALLSVLRYWLGKESVPPNEKELWFLLGTNPEEGTGPEQVTAGAQAFGLSAQMVEGLGVNDLPGLMAQGATPMLAIQAWSEHPELYDADNDSGHWVVLVGLDSDSAWFADPSTPGSYAYVPFDDLARRWHDLDNGQTRQGLAVIIRGNTPAADSATPDQAKPMG